MRLRRLGPALGLSLAAIGFAGCREDWQAKTYPARGTLTINGRPAAGAVVQLIARGTAPDERNSRPWALVEPDGAFQLSTYEPGSGAPPGEYGVAITWPVDATIMGSPDRLGGKFAAAATSNLSVTLKAEPNQIPLELTGVKVNTNPRPAGRHAPFEL